MKTVYDLISKNIIGKEVFYEGEPFTVKEITEEGYFILENYLNGVQVPLENMNKLELITSKIPQPQKCPDFTKLLDSQRKRFLKNPKKKF